MKQSGLFIVGFCLAIAPATFAIEPPATGVVFSDGQGSIEVLPIKKKVGELNIKVEKVTTNQLLRTLAELSGAKITFDPALKEGTFIPAMELWTKPEKMAVALANIYDLKVTITDKEWKVAPDTTPKKKAPRVKLEEQSLSSLLAAYPNQKAPAPWKRPDGMQMNVHPAPGQNLPEGSVPFEFNEKRVYRVPIVPAK